MTRLCPLFSGSSGNSYYIGSGEHGILVDCGRNAKQIENALAANRLDVNSLEAVFITHEHTDHVSAMKVFAARHKLRVYASPGTIDALEEKGLISDKIDIVPITAEGADEAGMFIKPFHISHDCREGVGYVIETEDGRKTAFATDTGIITDEIRSAISGCDTVVLESNHDVGMLRCGSYPYILKKRILSDVGHLSNELCAQTAVELVRSGTTRLLLAHLSRENNIPELARQASLCELEQNSMKMDIDFMLSVVPETYTAGSMIY